MMSERWVVVLSCYCITLVSPLLTAWGNRYYTRQSLVEYPDGYLPRMQSGIRGLLFPLVGTTLFLSSPFIIRSRSPLISQSSTTVPGWPSVSR